jgi:pimeloyl-ACP methyl ester carboxylesterase
MRFDEFTALRHTVETRSGPIAYVDSGEGPVALFVHGVATGAYLWRNVIGELAGERRCVALDLPLHGATPAADDQDFSIGALATVVADFCEALELESFDLVANDTGGAIAQLLAVRRPARVRTFTLTNCDTHDNFPPEAFKPTIELAARGELAPRAAAVLANLDVVRAGGIGAGYEHPERVTDETLRTYLDPLFGTPEAAVAFERLLTSLDSAELVAIEPDLRRFTAPTLVVWGTGDPFFGIEWAHWLRDTIPGVTEVVEVEGAKLFFPDERAGELVTHLRRHWAEHSADRPRALA